MPRHLLILALFAVAATPAAARPAGARSMSTEVPGMSCLRERSTAARPGVLNRFVTNGCARQVRFLMCAGDGGYSGAQCRSMRCRLVTLAAGGATTVRASSDDRIHYVAQRPRERLEMAGTERRCV